MYNSHTYEADALPNQKWFVWWKKTQIQIRLCALELWWCSEYTAHNFQAESSCDSSSEGCYSDGDSSGQDSHGTGVMDLEELGNFSSSLRAAREKKPEENSPREMVTSLLRESLTKQGYRIVGTHSGVKLCRWTKVLTFLCWICRHTSPTARSIIIRVFEHMPWW